VLPALPPSKCTGKSNRYVNSKYGFTLCVPNDETASDLSFAKFNHVYLKDFVSIKGTSGLPSFVFPIAFSGEKDSLLVFKKFEAEIFERYGDAIASRNLSTEKYTKPDGQGKAGTYSRVYDITLKAGGNGKFDFTYRMGGNQTFNALCFAYMAPAGIEGMSYALFNEARLLECVVLQFK
jgi:hypothetical protein